MNSMKLFQVLSLAGLLALAPMQGALAQANPSLMKPVAASKLAVNGVSLNGLRVNGHNLNGRKAGGAARSARRAGGRGGAGMTVVSIELPGGAHHAK